MFYFKEFGHRSGWLYLLVLILIHAPSILAFLSGQKKNGVTLRS